MSDERTSLIPGRNRRTLDDAEIRRATNMFLGLDGTVSTRYEGGKPTVCRIVRDEDGEPYAEIRFGEDIYPGDDVVAANALLSLKAAAAHELTHVYRWRDKQALPEEELIHIDEALTSLQAIQRYGHECSHAEIRELVSDAIQRLQLFVRESRDGGEEVESQDTPSARPIVEGK